MIVGCQLPNEIDKGPPEAIHSTVYHGIEKGGKGEGVTLFN